MLVDVYFATPNPLQNPPSMKKPLLCLLATVFISSYLLAQVPANNTCNLTSPLLSSGRTCVATTGTVANATLDGTINTCAGTERYDVWYRFVAQSTNPTITLSNLGANFTSPGLQIYSVGCGVDSIICGTTSVSPTTLVVGTTYHIRVFSTAATTPATNANFDICIIDPPANDLCINATNLGTLNGAYTATPGDLYYATQTNPAGSTCGNRYDVWYRFILPAGSSSVTITVNLNAPSNLGTGNTFIELFSVVNCATPSGTTTGGCNNISVPRRYNGLTAGTTYYFRVNTTVVPTTTPVTSWDFNVFAVPSNDECNNLATTLTPGSSVDGTLLAATSSGVAVAPCTGNPDDDVWYKFVAPYSYATVTLGNIGADLAASGARMQLFSGTCASLVSVGCGNDTKVINATGLTPTATYYIRVYSAGANPQAGAAWGFRISVTPSSPVVVSSGRMNEIYHQQIISAPQVLADPWEVTYGPDNNLWITESKGYRVYKMNPTTGVMDTVLNISQGSTFFTAPADVAFNCQFANGAGAQGGLAGLALHPKFLDATTPQNYVYISYIRTSNGGSSPTGIFFTNRLVRFTYNTGTGKLESPVSLCDTLPGSNDHNSQRMIIAPVVAGGTNYLFYAQGDMGAGQFGNRDRPNKAQNPASYEGKILRFNLVSDGDPGLAAWIPNSNPYSATSAVYSIGIRNNQGFAYDTTLNILYGSSHGPYSDDEINIIEGFRNYGHPLVIGYVADGNYNGTTTPSTNTSLSAGAAFTDNTGNSSCPAIGNEATNRAAIDANGNGLYKDAFFSAYPETNAVIRNIWQTNPGNGGWPSEGWSGLDIYTHTLVPGWKRSLVAASLKWGRLVRIKLGSAGITTLPNNTINDTISYFGSINRFRDMAFAPNGKDIYVVMDRSTSTSGPSTANPVVPACQGCLQKYSFLGYADAASKSSIPASIDVTPGVLNTCAPGTTITIDNTNNNLWVPITGPDGNIMAEIKANSNNLGVVTSSFYTKSGAIRQLLSKRYLHRNMTITPATQPVTPVAIRLYLTKAEFDALDADPGSGISSIADLKILKNTDACGPVIASTTEVINPVFAEAHGTAGYVLQGNINSFSSFYFANAGITLPVELVYFKGALQNNSTFLQWETINENNTSYFDVERSIDGRNFDRIGEVAASGNSAGPNQYSHIDNDVTNLSSAVIYYRLKMVDIDGQFKYSSIVTIYLADITRRIVLSPNPATDETKVMITDTLNGNANWKLVDNSGRVVMQNAIYIKRGSNSFAIKLGKLSAGLYFFKITGAGIDQHIKLQKL